MSSTGLPGDRLPELKRLLDHRRSNQPLRILETHSGLTGLIAEHAVGSGGHQFDGMWSSSLTASAVRGMPDIEAVDTTARLSLVKETLNVTTKPMIYDGDTGGTRSPLWSQYLNAFQAALLTLPFAVFIT